MKKEAFEADPNLREMRLALQEGEFSLSGRMSEEDAERMEDLMPFNVVDADLRIYRQLIKGLLRFERTAAIGESELPIEDTLTAAAMELQQLRALFASKGLKISPKTLANIMVYQGYEYWVGFLESEVFLWAAECPSKVKQQMARRPLMFAQQLTDAKAAYDEALTDPTLSWLHSMPSLIRTIALDHGADTLKFLRETATPEFQAVTTRPEYEWIASREGFLRQMCAERPHQIRELIEWAEWEVLEVETDPKYSWIVGAKGGQKSLLAVQLIKAPNKFAQRMERAKEAYEDAMADEGFVELFDRTTIVRVALENPRTAIKRLKHAKRDFEALAKTQGVRWVEALDHSMRAVKHVILRRLVYGEPLSNIMAELTTAESKFERAVNLKRAKKRLAHLREEVERKATAKKINRRVASDIRRWIKKLLREDLGEDKIEQLREFYIFLHSHGIDYPPELLLAHGRPIPATAADKVNNLIGLGFDEKDIARILRSNIQVLNIAAPTLRQKFKALARMGLNAKSVFVKNSIALSQNVEKMQAVYDVLFRYHQDRTIVANMITESPRVFMMPCSEIERTYMNIAMEMCQGDLDKAIDCVAMNPWLMCNGKAYQYLQNSFQLLVGRHEQTGAEEVFMGNPWSVNGNTSFLNNIYKALEGKEGVASAAAYVEAFPGLLSISPHEIREKPLAQLIQFADVPMQALKTRQRIEGTMRVEGEAEFTDDGSTWSYSAEVVAFEAFQQVSQAAFA